MTTCSETRATSSVIYQANPKELKRRNLQLLLLRMTSSPKRPQPEVRGVFFFCFFFVLFYFRFVYFIHCFAGVLRSGANEDFVSEGIVSFHGKMRCSQLLTAQISSNDDLKEEK